MGRGCGETQVSDLDERVRDSRGREVVEAATFSGGQGGVLE